MLSVPCMANRVEGLRQMGITNTNKVPKSRYLNKGFNEAHLLFYYILGKCLIEMIKLLN
jgi:hypothetical protein